MQIFWLEDARDDLAAIRRCIRRDSPEAARNVAQRIVAATVILAENPRAGGPGRWSGTRELVIPGTPCIAPVPSGSEDAKSVRMVML